MDRKNLFKLIGLLVFFIFVVSIFANKFYWYYSIWYFDIIMHTLSGFWVGLVAVYLFTSETLPSHPLWKMLFFVLVIGFGWEVFEFLFNNYIAQNSFDFVDSASDIVFDLIGGLCAILYLLVPFKNQRTGDKE